MKKVSVVVMDRERKASLEKLRDLGILHLEKKAVPTGAGAETLAGLLDRKAKTETALGILRSYKAPKKVPSAALLEGDALAEVLALGEEKKALQEQLSWNAKERSRIEKWGNFNPQDLKILAERGVVLIPYELSGDAYGALGEDDKFCVLGRAGSQAMPGALSSLKGAKSRAGVRGLAVGKPIAGETPFALPEKSLVEFDQATKVAEERLEAIEQRFIALLPAAKAIDRDLKFVNAEIEFEGARLGMDATGADNGVAWLTGYAPQDTVGQIKRAAAENGWALAVDDPGTEDEVPTLLRHNKFVSLINPLTDFLEIIPGYREADISGWFLVFFTIFFGMIFGDAGYGAILLLAGLFAVAKTAKKGVPTAFKLLLLLGFSNFVWGVLTCTWFGVEPDKLPAILRTLSLPLISNATAAQSARDEAIVKQNLMIFCFSLAVIQLSIGHIIAIIKDRSLKLLSNIGSIAMLVGMFNLVLALVVSNDYRQVPFLPPAIYLLAGGFVLTFIFANYEGSIGKSILESLKNIISTILGITNVFSDIMSYIRLWAVGLAGASISSTVNTMAGPLLGHFLVFLGVILLIFGHGLNIILNVLSVLVHAVRLNTLEFSSHVGLNWSGFAYKPFSKRI
ncbi:MAG: V-type ATP synthase subunit I [Treponema sp.]|nr:V-type ATP synthase subunit I [Treponema sp.]